MSSPEILTIEEVAKYLRVSERTIYEWAQKGEIPAGKIGASWRFKRSEIQRWADEKLGRSGRASSSKFISVKEVLRPERVLILKERRKEGALRELIESLATAPEVGNREELARAIFWREELMSTGIGFGIAVPHVRLDSVKDLVMAMGISRPGIADYESLDREPVHIICMIASGRYQHEKYLKTLAAVSSHLKEKSFRDLILTAPDARTIYDIMVNKDV